MSCSKSSKTKIVEMSPAVIQTIATAAPNIFFFTRRCLNGRNVACVRSKEIAARLIVDAVSMTTRRALVTTLNGLLKRMIVQQSQRPPKVQKKNEHDGPNKHISNCLVDHQVHASLAKSALFQVNNDSEGNLTSL